MHPADIVAAVKKTGTSLSALARLNGLSDAAIRYSLRPPAKRAEEALIAHLGLPPQRIWPDRYSTTGVRLIRRRRSSSAQPRAKGQ